MHNVVNSYIISKTQNVYIGNSIELHSVATSSDTIAL